MVIFLEIITKQNIDDKISNIFKDKNTSFKYKYISNNEDETSFLAKTFAKYISIGDIITLKGDLGSGKTVFVKGIGNFFNIQEEISSPTFTIVNEYQTYNFTIYHFDVYRINDVSEFIYTVGDDYFSKGPCFIEWGEIIEEILPKNTIHIDFKKINDYSREIIIWRN